MAPLRLELRNQATKAYFWEIKSTVEVTVEFANIRNRE